jgi:hypothetical protein
MKKKRKKSSAPAAKGTGSKSSFPETSRKNGRVNLVVGTGYKRNEFLVTRNKIKRIETFTQ